MAPSSHTTFPVSEGIGIFVGIVAWDLITEGQMDAGKAAIIAACCSVAWFGVRCLRDWMRNRRHH